MSGTTETLEGTAVEPEGRGFLDRIRTAFDILRFRTTGVDTALDDDGAFATGLGMAALGGLAAAAGSAATLPGGIGLALGYTTLSLAIASLIHLAARVVLDSEADFVRFYRGFGHTYPALWLSGIPAVHAFLGWALIGWQLAAAVLVAERAYRLRRGQAILVVLVPAVVALGLAVLLNGLVVLGALVRGLVF